MIITIPYQNRNQLRKILRTIRSADYHWTADGNMNSTIEYLVCFGMAYYKAIKLYSESQDYYFIGDLELSSTDILYTGGI
jgi:hypothetical protein